MSYRVVKNSDGSVSLYVDGEFDVRGDDDVVDARLWQLYGKSGADEDV